ncbi:MAG: NAD(P)H-dependent glycerol-3-phosphate dehydrogenase [Streptococcaceae bacterium]|jgi:glycerol-3-phosphate dehydrogenase (NAD(P)+)|nr:NAD(P)H-dependent glycerol-3-phosphate dehydrogenase [Streptococcaceae bacterium]
MEKQRIAILGAGSWGTALAQVLNDNGHIVRIWGNVLEQIEEINSKHTNRDYLPDLVLSQNIRAYHDLAEAVSGVDGVLFVVPTKVMRVVAKQYAEVVKEKHLLIHASKGLEQGTHKCISQVLADEVPASYRQAIIVLSGPSHAEEVVVRDITTITVASADEKAAFYVRDLFTNDYFRIYTNHDVMGVETAGALKNIIALGAGALHGLGYGDNAKAAIITRGLAEITRLGVAMGAEPLTYMGLSGMGDLIVTATSIHSRNWRAGDCLGRGEKLADVEKKLGMVIEGVSTAKVAHELSRELKVEMPITEAIYDVLYNHADVREVIKKIMLRDARPENEYKNCMKI